MSAPAARPVHPEHHYLECELQDLVSDAKVWQSIQAGSLDGVWYWDRQRPENKWMSAEFWRLLGYDPASRAVNAPAWQTLIHPDDLTRTLESLNTHCARPDHPFDQIVRYLHADGSTLWVRCRGKAIRSGNGVPARMLGTYNDVTPLKAAEQSAVREHRLAARTNEDLQAFAYSASHDLKAPANTIHMLLQEARRAMRIGDADDADRMLIRAETTNAAMRVMVDKLLEYTHVLGHTEESTEVDLDTLVSDVLDSLAADIVTAKAQITVAPLGRVRGIEWQLRKLFQNLILNAMKFQPEGRTPRLEIRASKAWSGKTVIEVSDNGIGIAPEHRGRIFDLFTRLHGTSSFAGSGIGLAFCARVARAHGTEIKVFSEPGQGTTFSFELPSVEGVE